MPNPIEEAMGALLEMITIVEQKDYERFLTHVSDRIRDRVDEESFQSAINRHARKPLSLSMMDKSKSLILNDDPLTVKLKMKNGRTLATFIKTSENWVTDNVFW